MAAALTWLFVGNRSGWSDESKLAAIALVAGVIASLAAPFGEPLFERWLTGRPQTRSGLEPSADLVEGWRSELRAAVLARRVDGDDSQLGQMVRQAIVIDLRAIEGVGFSTSDEGEMRIQVRGRVRSLREIVTRWATTRDRLVILGDPGYGKTVAALSLLAVANGSRDTPGQPVAELFGLAAWYRWKLTHGAGSLRDWLVDELDSTYPELPRPVASALVDRGLVVPVLDGLDEVPESHRIDCKEAIDAYAGRTEPFRRFAVTCRAGVYRQLAPNWVIADRQVGLIGLEPDQIRAVLDERTCNVPEWHLIHEQLTMGNQSLYELFRSPLRLSIALQAYRSGGAAELLDLDSSKAEGHLWDRLLALGSPTFDGEGPDRVRSWLDFLANTMKRRNSQRFALHELPSYAPNSHGAFAWFRYKFASTVALFGGLLGGLAFGVVAENVPAALLGGVLGGIVGWELLVFLLRGGLRRMIIAWLLFTALLGLTFGWYSSELLFAFLGGAGVGLLGGMAFGYVGWMVYWMEAIWGQVWLWQVWQPFDRLSGPPTQVKRVDPSVVLTLARNEGLKRLFVAAVSSGLVVGGVVTLLSGVPLGLVVALFLGALAGLASGMPGALGPWLYHHWLRHQMARLDLLPRRLADFLNWCAEPERGWLRVSDAYEFRHRDLLDHLAAGTAIEEEP